MSKFDQQTYAHRDCLSRIAVQNRAQRPRIAATGTAFYSQSKYQWPCCGIRYRRCDLLQRKITKEVLRTISTVQALNTSQTLQTSEMVIFQKCGMREGTDSNSITCEFVAYIWGTEAVSVYD